MIIVTLMMLMDILLAPIVSQFIDYDELVSNQEYLESCICVPYWQCKEDYSGLVEDGVDIIDIRITRHKENEIPCTGDFDVCCRVECGKKNSGIISRFFDGNTSSRILGKNNEATFGELPWMLAIIQEGVFRCGGSLIHPQVAVTAAHCVTPPEKYVVRAGEWNWETKNEPLPYQDRFSQKVIIHPQYHVETLQNDIALLVLEKPFILAENIGIICIPSLQHLTKSKRKCIASGWGKDSSKIGKYQSILKKITIPIIPQRQCMNALRKEALGPFFYLHRSFICAGGTSRKDTCKGDGGGPLICPISDESSTYHQVGIVSWGLTCGIHDAPGIYVNVALFSDWIDSQMIYYNFDTRIYRSTEF